MREREAEMRAAEMRAAEMRGEQMRAGRRAFERGEFFEAHEHWEAAWNASEGAERRRIQGMIQVAAALHKLAGGHADAARSLLAKALPKLADAAPPGRGDGAGAAAAGDGAGAAGAEVAALAGLDIARFARDAAALLAALERGDSPAPSTVQLHDAPR